MRILGLSEQGAPLWAASAAFGLMYSGAVIIDQASKTVLDKEALERLHISIGINHKFDRGPIFVHDVGAAALLVVGAQADHGGSSRADVSSRAFSKKQIPSLRTRISCGCVPPLAEN